MPRRAVDGPRHVDHQRPHQGVVGALLRRAEAGAGSGQQLRARERAVQIVVGAGVESRVRRPLVGGDRERQQPCLLEPLVGPQGAADAGHVEPGRLAVDDHEVGVVLLERLQRVGDVAHGAHRVARGTDPGLDLRLGEADDEHAGLPAPH